MKEYEEEERTKSSVLKVDLSPIVSTYTLNKKIKFSMALLYRNLFDLEKYGRIIDIVSNDFLIIINKNFTKI